VERTFVLPGLGEFFFMSIILKDTNSTSVALIPGILVATLVWAIAPILPRPTPLLARPPAVRDIARSNPLFVIGLGIAALYVVLGIIGPWVVPYKPYEFAGSPNENPSWDAWLGTQRDGLDLLSLLLHSTRTSLEFAAMVVVFGALPGALVGGFARRLAPRRGRFSRNLIQIASEAASLVLALPALAVVLLVFVTFDWDKTMATVAAGGMAFVLVARATLTAGEDRNSLILSALGATAVAAAGAIAIQVYLSFFMLYPADQPGWGDILNSGRNSYPWNHIVMIAPAVVITIFTAGFLLIRTALDDLDPPRLYER
jgi:peptide/nickel transport system permease protein